MPVVSPFSPAALGFVRCGVVSPELRVADVAFNVRATDDALVALAAGGVRLALFPELGLTGYTCADLFYQSLLLDAAAEGVQHLARRCGELDIAAAVGFPLNVGGRLYNCSALLAGGRVHGVVPKSYLPSTNEFYEERWFTPALRATTAQISLRGEMVPFGTDLLFEAENLQGLVIGIEVCEDLWAVSPPSGEMAMAGATLILNGSGSNELLGKVDYRRELVRQQSARCLSAYLYAGAGANESTTDLVFAGHSMIAENGTLLAETERFSFGTVLATCDVDIQRLVHERIKNNTYSSSAAQRSFRTIRFSLPGEAAASNATTLLRPNLTRLPFVPGDPEKRAAHCREIFSLQSTGLARRLRHTGTRRITLGISGGLDSTLALLVTVKAFDVIGLPREGVVAITMPGFGTTPRTRSNAERLAALLGVSFREIPIVEAVRQHFRDIGHDESVHDVTYENAQARERTQVLMDVANQIGGFNVGTGDLSELALGWCTYNGDQMSMYHVNSGVPKTLVRYLVDWAADEEFTGEAATILHDITATPITPELLPLGAGGELAQVTEDTIGPYVLHDFFLYYTLRYQFGPREVFALARQAFSGEFDAKTILGWLKLFYHRFFTQQFKRSAMPDGPKVGSVALSPRGDWRMPSDAEGSLWSAEVDRIAQEL